MLTVLALLAAPAAAQDQAPEQRAAADAATRSRVEAAASASGFAGIYAVSADGRRVAGGAVGESAPGAPFLYESVFPLASVTKQVVATLVMRQVADGRMALDAPAARYLPSLGGERGRGPTVRELLQHRAGLRNPNDSPADATGDPDFYSTGPTGLDWCLAGRGPPGGQWRYNNCDYIVLGAMLERLTKRPLPQLYAERIAGPLGIAARFVIGPNDPRSDAYWAGGPTAADRAMIARYGAAGALVGTAEDLLAFDEGLMMGALIPDDARAAMWRGDPKLGFQALGQWAFEAPVKGCAGPVRLIERRGAIGRFQVRNVIAPDRHVAVVLLTNRAEGAFDFGEIWQGKGVSHDLLAAVLCPA